MAKVAQDRLFVLYDPSAWDPEKVGGASGVYISDTFEKVDEWRKDKGHTGPIYSYIQGRKGLQDERMEDKMPGGLGGQPTVVEVPDGIAGSAVLGILAAAKGYEIMVVLCAFLALKLSRFLGWDNEREERT